MAQVFLAYAAGENGGNASEMATVLCLRHLLAQAQITYWEYPASWSPDADPEVIISRATEACDNYLLVLSPRSLTDARCLQGLLFALSLNKRIVPVLAETVSADRLPEPLQTLDAIDFRLASTGLKPSAQGHQLVQALRQHADYHQAHTYLLVKALAWERQQRNPALLLQRKELVEYRRWLMATQGRSHHRPIQLQTLYVAESTRHGKTQGSAVDQGIGWLNRWL